MMNITGLQIMLSIRITDVSVRCELDTGAALSIMDEKDWRLVRTASVRRANLETTPKCSP